MALDIFSSFDDHHKVWNNFYFLIWTTIPILLISGILINTPIFNKISAPKYLTLNTINKLIKTTNSTQIGGSFMGLYRFILVILFLNITGLIPYIFRITRHIVVNFPLTIVVWLRVTLLSIFYRPKTHLAHFRPSGAPLLLSPVLAVIELVSNIVRPLTLRVRLTANLRTGHVLFNLLGDRFVQFPILIEIIIASLGLGYILFEIGVCVVQTYIITLLSSLYTDEHPNKEIWTGKLRKLLDS